jgi:membrane associated rhomboid family serine protease
VSPRDPSFGNRRFTLSGFGGGPGGGFGMLGGPPPRDLLIVLCTLFVTFALQFFEATRIVPALLRLTPLVWHAGFVWQLVTYPFVGYGGPSFWFLVELLILFMFGRDAYAGLGRKHFWRLVLITAVVAGALALAVDAVQESATGLLQPGSFPLLQGQRVLLAILVAAFATANRRATILLFFVLPIEARWFLGLEILFAFIGFLASHDLGGFLGICAAVGLSFLYVRDGGFGRGLRQTRLRVERWWLQRKLERARRRRGLRVIKGQGDGGNRWLH